MTKKKAQALTRELDVKCDEPYIFACKVGCGCQVACRSFSNNKALLTIMLAAFEEVFHNLKGNVEDVDRFKKELSIALASIILEDD